MEILKIGKYRLESKIGEGAMTVVYRAYDPDLGRYVAVKILHSAFLDDAEASTRFYLEIKALAGLSHPSIVRLLDAGREGNSLFYVMEEMPGGSLKQMLGKPVSYQQAARLLIPVAQGLAYAHSQGIIHRDVKPSNILFSESGTVKIADFGISRVLSDEETRERLTETGASLGTPEYMSPEVAMGKISDERSDIYSMGIVLYELITGHKVFEADTPFAVMLQHVNNPVPSPRKHVPNLPIEVERVVLRALAKKPEKRFATMSEFTRALERIASRKDGDQAWLLPALIKPPVYLYIIGVVLILGLTSAYILRKTGLLNSHAPTQLQAAQVMPTNTITAISSETQTSSPSPTPSITHTTGQSFSPTPRPSATTLPTATPYLAVLANTPIPLPIEAITAQNAGSLVELARWGTSEISDMSISLDGKYIASATSTGLYISDPLTGKLVRFLESESWLRRVVFSPDSSMVAAWGLNRQVTVWRVSNWEAIGTFGNKEPPVDTLTISDTHYHTPVVSPHGYFLYLYSPGLAFSPDSKTIAVGAIDGSVRGWDIQSRKQTINIQQEGGIRDIAFSVYGEMLFIASKTGVSIWDPLNSSLIRSLEVPKEDVDEVRFVAVSPDNQYFAAFKSVEIWEPINLGTPSGDAQYKAAHTKNICLWRVRDGAFIRCQGEYVVNPLSLSFTPDSKWIILGDIADDIGGKSYKVMNLQGNITYTYSFPWVRTMHIVDGQKMISGDFGGKVVISDWEDGLLSGSKEVKLDGSFGGSYQVVFSPDDQMLASVSPFRLWDIHTGSVIQSYEKWDFGGVGFRPDENAVYLVNASTLYKLPLRHDAEIQEIGPGKAYSTVPFAPDGKTYDCGGVRTSDGYEIRQVPQYQYKGQGCFYDKDSAVYGLDFSANPLRIAIYPLGSSQEAAAIDIKPTDSQYFHVRRDAQGKDVVQWSALAVADSFSRVAITLPDGNILIWNVKGEKAGSYFTFRTDIQDNTPERVDKWGLTVEKPAPIRTIDLSHQGDVLIATDSAGTIFVYNARDGSFIKKLPAHRVEIQDLVFSWDDQLIATGSNDGTIRLWGVMNGDDGGDTGITQNEHSSVAQETSPVPTTVPTPFPVGHIPDTIFQTNGYATVVLDNDFKNWFIGNHNFSNTSSSGYEINRGESVYLHPNGPDYVAELVQRSGNIKMQDAFIAEFTYAQGSHLKVGFLSNSSMVYENLEVAVSTDNGKDFSAISGNAKTAGKIEFQPGIVYEVMARNDGNDYFSFLFWEKDHPQNTLTMQVFLVGSSSDNLRGAVMVEEQGWVNVLRMYMLHFNSMDFPK